jgi:hypothetical protein
LFSLIAYLVEETLVKQSRVKGVNHKKQYMDTLNITINIQEKPVSLTLEPEETDTYKVIYHDMLVGTISRREDGQTWRELPIDQVSPGIYKMYEHDAAKQTPKILLDEKTIAEIKDEIERQPQ